MVAADAATRSLVEAAVVGLLSLACAAAIPTCHELAHFRLLGSRRLTQALGCFVGLYVLLNFQIYRRFHLDHHRYIGKPLDPEGSHTITGVAAYWCALLWSPFAGFFSQFFRVSILQLPLNLHDAERTPALINHAILCAWIGVAAYLTWLFPMSMAKYYWFPVFLGAFALDAFLSFPEHVTLDEQDGARVSRIVETNVLLGWITWNQNLHALHHGHPSVPGWKLPGLYRRQAEAGLLGDYMIERGYLRFHARFLRDAWRARRRARA